MHEKKPVWIVYELVKKKVSFINFLMMHFLFKTDFSLQYQYNIKQTSDENKEKYQ